LAAVPSAVQSAGVLAGVWVLLAFSFTSLPPWLRCLGVCPGSTLNNTFLLLLGFWPSWAVGLVPSAGSRSRRCVRWVRSPLVWSCPGPAAWLGWSSLEVLFLAPSLLRLLLRCGGPFAFCFSHHLVLALAFPRFGAPFHSCLRSGLVVVVVVH